MSLCPVVLQYKGVLMLDWPLIGIMSLTADGSTPHLVLQAKREMPSASDQHINWFGECACSSGGNQTLAWQQLAGVEPAMEGCCWGCGAVLQHIDDGMAIRLKKMSECCVFAAAAAVSVIGKDSTSPPLPCTVSTKLKQQQGGTGGSVLALNILQVQGKPKLVMLATSSATFKTRCVVCGYVVRA